MKDFWLNVARTLVAAAIIFTAQQLWKMNERLTRIESRLGINTAQSTP